MYSKHFCVWKIISSPSISIQNYGVRLILDLGANFVLYILLRISVSFSGGGNCFFFLVTLGSADDFLPRTKL